MRFSMLRAPQPLKFLAFFSILGALMLGIVASQGSKIAEGCYGALEAVSLLLTVTLCAAYGWGVIKESPAIRTTRHPTLSLIGLVLGIVLSGHFVVWWFHLRWWWALIMPIIACLTVLVVIGAFSNEDLIE
jgi:hypothetical protein